MKNNSNYQSGIGAVAIIVIIALLALGGGAYYYLTNEGNIAETGSEKEVIASSVEEFKSLLSSSDLKDITCTYDSADVDASGSVVLKIKDSKNYRKDAKVVYRGEEIVTHWVGLVDTIYSWDDTYEQGVKNIVGEGGLMSSLKDRDPESDYVYISNFSCKRGGPSAAELELPSNIDFLDASAMGDLDFNLG